eukprot:364341-Chlamydomonas_euryale.AAC.15
MALCTTGSTGGAAACRMDVMFPARHAGSDTWFNQPGLSGGKNQGGGGGTVDAIPDCSTRPQAS